MTNNLKNFLEQYHDNEVFSDDQIGEIQYVIIPKILDLVENEIDNKRALDSEIFAASGNNDEESRDRIKVFEDISTIIKQLRV